MRWTRLTVICKRELLDFSHMDQWTENSWNHGKKKSWNVRFPVTLELTVLEAHITRNHFFSVKLRHRAARGEGKKVYKVVCVVWNSKFKSSWGAACRFPASCILQFKHFSTKLRPFCGGVQGCVVQHNSIMHQIHFYRHETNNDLWMSRWQLVQSYLLFQVAEVYVWKYQKVCE